MEITTCKDCPFFDRRRLAEAKIACFCWHPAKGGWPAHHSNLRYAKLDTTNKLDTTDGIEWWRISRHHDCPGGKTTLTFSDRNLQNAKPSPEPEFDL